MHQRLPCQGLQACRYETLYEAEPKLRLALIGHHGKPKELNTAGAGDFAWPEGQDCVEPVHDWAVVPGLLCRVLLRPRIVEFFCSCIAFATILSSFPVDWIKVSVSSLARLCNFSNMVYMRPQVLWVSPFASHKGLVRISSRKSNCVALASVSPGQAKLPCRRIFGSGHPFCVPDSLKYRWRHPLRHGYACQCNNGHPSTSHRRSWFHRPYRQLGPAQYQAGS